MSDIKISHKDYVQGKDVDQLRNLISVASSKLHTLEQAKKVMVLAVDDGSFVDSYFAAENMDGALDRLRDIISSDEFRQNYKFKKVGIVQQWFYTHEIDEMRAAGDLIESSEVTDD